MQERMCALEGEINEFKERYDESRKDIEQRQDHVCDRCGREYATENGLHNHRRKKCSSKRTRINRKAGGARTRRAHSSLPPASSE